MVAMVAFGVGRTIPEGLDGSCIAISVDAWRKARVNSGMVEGVSFVLVILVREVSARSSGVGGTLVEEK